MSLLTSETFDELLEPRYTYQTTSHVQLCVHAFVLVSNIISEHKMNTVISSQYVPLSGNNHVPLSGNNQTQ